MAFFLGKDVSIKISTENESSGVTVSAAGVETFPATAGTFASQLVTGSASGAAVTGPVTACDVSIGSMDEDIAYFGMRSQTKAEIKKDTTVSITRKKTSPEWDTIYNDVRYGTSGTAAWLGLEEPTTTHGYRLFISISPKTGTSEVITIMGACVQSHTVTVNTDGTMDETIEFMSYITPVYSSTQYNTAITTNL